MGGLFFIFEGAKWVLKEICLIVSGGEYSELPEDMKQADYVIACDRGWEHAGRMGLAPDLIVGDFDSSELPTGAAKVCHLPVDKDDTDTMYAAKCAYKAGYKRVVICCGFGGRLDHALANIQTGVYLASRGVETTLFGADTQAVLLAGGQAVIPEKKGWSLSVFALSDICSGVTIKGTKYECENEKMINAFPLGVSNTWSGEEARISVDDGMLLILMSGLKEGEHI